MQKFLGLLLRMRSSAIGQFFSRPKYHKIPKINPGAYIFQRPFLRGLFLKGLIFGRAYSQREICVSQSIGLALQLEVHLPFLLCFTQYLRTFSKYKPPGGLYLEGRFNRGLFASSVWGAYIWRGLYQEGLIFGILWQQSQKSMRKVTWSSFLFISKVAN